MFERRTTVTDRLFRHSSTGCVVKDEARFRCRQADLELLHSSLARREKRELEVPLSLFPHKALAVRARLAELWILSVA